MKGLASLFLLRDLMQKEWERKTEDTSLIKPLRNLQFSFLLLTSGRSVMAGEGEQRQLRKFRRAISIRALT